MPKQERETIKLQDKLYEPLDWFVLRTPLLPIEKYFALSQEHQKVSPALAGLVKTNPKIATALSVGNPNFFDALQRANPEKQDVDTEKLMGKLLRLLTRMSSRCTPMGMYAGLATAAWEEKTDLSLDQTGTRIRTRPDSEITANLALRSEKEFLKDLHLVLNPTSALYANRVYVIEKAAVIKEEDVNGVTIEATPEIKTIMSLARSPIAYEKLLARLVASSEIPQTDLEKLILQLVELTVLLTNLRPSNVVGAEQRLLAGLKTIPAANDTSEQLEHFINGARAFDSSLESSPASDHAQQYKDLTAEGQAIFASSTGVSLQTDMQLSLHGKSVNKMLLKDAQTLVQLSVDFMRSPAEPLLDYKQRFMAAYEGKEVPLLELINPDLGLGLASNSGASEAPPVTAFNSNRAILNDLVHDAIRDGKLEVELPEDVLARLIGKTTPETNSSRRYPLSLDLMFTVLAESPEAIDAGNYRLLHSGAMAIGAGRFLGRFAYMLDSESSAKLDELLLKEQSLQSKKILADISSLPRRLRLGNVCMIPILRKFNLALDSCPDLLGESQSLALDDLVVGMENGRFYLRSVSHDAEVVTCSAHLTNPLFGTALAKFLNDISLDGIWRPCGFRWDGLEYSLFLPRVRYGKLILSAAQWNVQANAKDREVCKTQSAFEQWLCNWRQRWFVPRYIYLSSADNRLLIDLENSAQTNELRRELLDEKITNIHLEEAFVGEQDVWLPGPDGRYVSEFVAMFTLSQKQVLAQEAHYKIENKSDPKNIGFRDRVRLPGTDCLYVKLYGGKNLEDELLSTSLLKVLNEITERRMINSWFFIRYSDPEPHLRLRLFGNEQTLKSQVYPLVCQLGDILCKDLLRKKITIETYDREIERYGGLKAIELAEQLFAADSVFIAHFIQDERNGLRKEDRVNTCAYTIDKLLEALGLDVERRLAWYKLYTLHSKITAGQAYRERKDALARLFSSSAESIKDAHLAKWQGRLEQIGQDYKHLEQTDSLTGTALPGIYRSFVHMHCNRLGIDLQKEALALGLAERACQSVKSRQKGTA